MYINAKQSFRICSDAWQAMLLDANYASEKGKLRKPCVSSNVSSHEAIIGLKLGFGERLR